jgi:hypothetical protein
MASSRRLEAPTEFPTRRAGGAKKSRFRSAIWLIRHMCEHLGLDDLGASDVLDFGCGVKFTQAFVNCFQPVRRYVGVDVYREMIEFPPR